MPKPFTKEVAVKLVDKFKSMIGKKHIVDGIEYTVSIVTIAPFDHIKRQEFAAIYHNWIYAADQSINAPEKYLEEYTGTEYDVMAFSILPFKGLSGIIYRPIDIIQTDVYSRNSDDEYTFNGFPAAN